MFVYDSKQGSVVTRQVTLGAMIDGRILIQSGVSIGDLLVVAVPRSSRTVRL